MSAASVRDHPPPGAEHRAADRPLQRDDPDPRRGRHRGRRPARPGGADRRGRARRDHPRLDLLDVRLPADGHHRPRRPGARRRRGGGDRGAADARADDRAPRRALVFIAGQAAVFWAAFRLAPASPEVEALARTYSRHPHLGRAGGDRDLRADRLADRHGAGARRAGAAAADERRQRRARPLVRARPRLGRRRGRGGDADRRVVGARCSGSGSAARPSPARSGATGRGCSTRRGCGGWRGSTATS